MKRVFYPRFTFFGTPGLRAYFVLSSAGRILYSRHTKNSERLRFHRVSRSSKYPIEGANLFARIFSRRKADNAGGLSPSKEDNAAAAEKDRKDIGTFIGS